MQKALPGEDARGADLFENLRTYLMIISVPSAIRISTRNEGIPIAYRHKRWNRLEIPKNRFLTV